MEEGISGKDERNRRKAKGMEGRKVEGREWGGKAWGEGQGRKGVGRAGKRRSTALLGIAFKIQGQGFGDF